MIVTQSSKIRKLISLAQRYGASSAPILLTGESGTGKELFAQLIHAASPRHATKMVQVNCAALSKNLIESELFGHEKGSFTDAISTRQGRFELAEGSTLLLDEISEIPISTQAKLLRVLESNEYERVGSSESRLHNVRIIASSNKDLSEEVQVQTFRLDLFHRINVLQLRIPPLRERIEDIPILSMHFVDRFKCENSVPIRGFTHRAMQAMADYHWPGNIRELRNVIHRACILSESPLIEQDYLEFAWNERGSQSCDYGLPERWLHTELADIERQVITAAIHKFGNQRIVAEKLGVSQRTLTNKIRQYRETQHVRPDAA